jgi:hypothetical protein
MYRFRGARGVERWPRDDGYGLGACGMWNFLWRLGIHASDWVPGQDRPEEAVLWATVTGAESDDVVGRVREWHRGGGYILAAGHPSAWARVFAWDSTPSWDRPEHPNAGLAYVLPDRAPELVAPPRWRFAAFATCPGGARLRGTMASVQGERQTPGRASLVPLANAPAIVLGDRYCYVNGNPFAAFQSWLQGQEDLHTWLAWRPRLFWLDEWVAAVASLVSDLPPLRSDIRRKTVPALASTTVVVRHDVDHSRDRSYLDEEAARGIAATHAVLRDRNAAFWVRQLETYPTHECAFHYNTGARAWWPRVRALSAGQTDGSYKPARRAVSGRGLLKQVRWARRNGIDTATIHRHLAFLVYPEWVDAMHAVFEAEPEVLGGSSLFRGQVLRWGAERVDGLRGSIGDSPDAQFPLWLPFKVAHAGRGGLRLRGWEATSVMEPEPELVDQLLRHRIPSLPQRVITLTFHPAHARSSTFARDGSLPKFKQTLDVIRDNGADVRPLRDVYRESAAAIA